MSGASLTRRYWSSLTGRGGPRRYGPRARTGYTLWQRYWASLIGAPLLQAGRVRAVPAERASAAPQWGPAPRWSPAAPAAPAAPSRPLADVRASVDQLVDRLSAARQISDRRRIRVAATALFERMLREPASAALGLGIPDLLESLSQENRFLGYTASRLSALRSGARIAPGPRLDIELAQAEGDQRDAESAAVFRDPFHLRLGFADPGRVEISASAPLEPGEEELVASTYGVMLLPVRVDDAGGSSRYLLVLRPVDGELDGQLNLAIPAGHFVSADMDGPPIGVAEAESLDEEEVSRSVRAVTTNSAMAQWQRLAENLPAGHRLRRAIQD